MRSDDWGLRIERSLVDCPTTRWAASMGILVALGGYPD